MSADERREPHQWRWLNGFWAKCSCGFTDSSFSEILLRRRMNRHVEVATLADLVTAQPRPFDLSMEVTRDQ